MDLSGTLFQAAAPPRAGLLGVSRSFEVGDKLFVHFTDPLIKCGEGPSFRKMVRS